MWWVLPLTTTLGSEPLEALSHLSHPTQRRWKRDGELEVHYQAIGGYALTEMKQYGNIGYAKVANVIPGIMLKALKAKVKISNATKLTSVLNL